MAFYGRVMLKHISVVVPVPSEEEVAAREELDDEQRLQERGQEVFSLV